MRSYKALGLFCSFEKKHLVLALDSVILAYTLKNKPVKADIPKLRIQGQRTLLA